MKQRRLLQVLLPLMLLLALVAVLHWMSQVIPGAPRVDKPQPLPPLVPVATFSRADYPLVIHAQGRVQPRAVTQLMAEVSGKVSELTPQFVAGGLVKGGDSLLQLEDADYRVALQGAEAELAKARALLLEEQARASVAASERSRRGFIDAPALALRKPQLARDKANVEAATALLERARRDLERTRIRAPYDALISKRQVNVGQFVSRGVVIGELFDIGSAEIRLALTRDELRQLKLPGLRQLNDSTALPPVVISKVFADGDERWQGVIARSERVVEAQSRMTYVVARVDDPYGLQRDGEFTELAFGSFVSAEIQAGVLSGVIRIPRSSLRSDGRVMVIDDEERVQLRQIQLQHQDQQWLYVSEGLEAGETLALLPLPTATEGMQVRSRVTEGPDSD